MDVFGPKIVPPQREKGASGYIIIVAKNKPAVVDSAALLRICCSKKSLRRTRIRHKLVRKALMIIGAEES
jgi:hypothetical protein